MKKIIITMFALSLFGLLPGLAMFINAMGCDYHINGQQLKKGEVLEYDGVCNNGFATFLEINKTKGSEWRLSTIQLSWSNYIIYLIMKRTQISSGNQGVLDTYNHGMSDFMVVNVTYFILNNKMIFIQTSPRWDAAVMEKDGYLDFMDKLTEKEKE